MSTKIQYSPRLGQALALARRSAALTQADLAARAGLSRAAVLQIESGQGRLDTVINLARQIDMRVDGNGLPPGDESIGSRFAKLRRTRAFSQRAAADLAEISVPTVAAIEAGTTRVHVAAVEKLANVLRVKPMLVPLRTTVTQWFKSSVYDAWTTPVDLAKVLADAVGGQFDIDVASPGARDSPIPARQHFTAAMDGLSLPWVGVVWANPPYGRGLRDWVKRAAGQVACGNAKMVVALIPANVDTSYWHDYCEGVAQYHRFLRGRLKFGASANGAPFGSAIVVWGGDDMDRQRIDDALTQWEAERRGCRTS